MPATFQYFPFDAGPGSDATEPEWVDLFTWMRTTGILSTNVPLDPSVDDLAITPGSGLEVQIAVGKAFITGTYFSQSDDYSYYAITPNNDPDGYDRIDLFVLQTDFTANTTAYLNIEGTPAMSPVAPTPTQNSLIWQLPLAELYVANGATFFNPGDITDERVRSVQGDSGSSAVTLSSAGAGESLVADGVGPDIENKSLIEGAGISLTSDASTVTITNTNGFPYSNATVRGCMVTGLETVRIVANSSAITAQTDFYTVPAGKRFCIDLFSNVLTGGACSNGLFVKIGGSYYTLIKPASGFATGFLTNGNTSANYIAEEGEILAYSSSSTEATNIFVMGRLFDNTSPIKTAKLTSLSSGNNTLYTCPASTIAIISPDEYCQSAQNAVRIYNTTGSTRTYIINNVPSAGSPATTNQCATATTTTDSQGTFSVGSNLEAGGFISINSDSSTAGQFAYVTVTEIAI